MEGIENILRVGARKLDARLYANLVEEAGGLDKLEMLQHHENIDVYRKAVNIVREFFDNDEMDADQDDDNALQSNGQPKQPAKFYF